MFLTLLSRLEWRVWLWLLILLMLGSLGLPAFNFPCLGLMNCSLVLSWLFNVLMKFIFIVFYEVKLCSL